MYYIYVQHIARATMEDPEPVFISDTAYDILQSTILKQVKSFYKEISSLICCYLHCRLQIGQVLDVYDERGDWFIGCVVALRIDYVGIHYNGYSCDYDDWIHYESFRLAPLHSYSCHRFRSDNFCYSQEYKWRNTLYNEFLASISPGYRDRLKPAGLSKHISTCTFKYDPTKSKDQNLIEALVALQSYNQSLDVRLHTELLHCPNSNAYKPHTIVSYDRATLEKKARIHRKCHSCNSTDY